METNIRELLAAVVHPESGRNIVESGILERIAATPERIAVTLRFPKTRDPFAVKIKNRTEELLHEAYPEAKVVVTAMEGGTAPRPEPKAQTTTGGIKSEAKRS